MEQAVQQELIHRLFTYLDTGTTAMAPELGRNPVTAYTCPKRLTREERLLFRTMPLFLGFSSDWPDSGSYVADDLAGVPVLVVRGGDNRLRAFLNVCRHRGAPVAEGEGRKRLFTCPYHAWSYDWEGRLAAVPDERSFKGCARADYGLTPIPVVERDGLVWVGLTPGAELDLDAHLGALGPELASYGLERFRPFCKDRITRRMNWKSIVDTFLEAYHLPALHKRTVDPILHGNTLSFDSFGPHIRMAIPRRTFDQLRSQPESEWDIVPYTAILYVLFPNTVFVVQGGHIETWLSFPEPGEPGRASTEFRLYTPGPVETDKGRRFYEKNRALALETVDKEDFPLGEAIYRGYFSGAQQEVTYGRNEPGLIHYHRSLRERLGLEEPETEVEIGSRAA